MYKLMACIPKAFELRGDRGTKKILCKQVYWNHLCKLCNKLNCMKLRS